MRRAVARDFARLPGARVVMTLDDRFEDEAGPWATARVGPGQEEERFLDLAVEADYTILIAPETGGVLARRTRALERAGVTLLGSSSEAIELTGDKLRLAAHWTQRGIVTPECRIVRPAEGLPEDLSYPAVLKPVDGAGSVDTYLIPSAALLPEGALGMPQALLQPWVRGVPMSASFLVAVGGWPTLIGVGRQWVRLKEGRRFVYRGGTVPFPGAPEDPMLRRALSVVPGLRGFVGLDFLWDEEARRVTVLEINPRPTTSLVALVHRLPPGALARAWLDGGAGFDVGEEEVEHFLASQPPVTFSRDGRIRTRKVGTGVE